MPQMRDAFAFQVDGCVNRPETSMTEQEWLACTDPRPMLVFLQVRDCDRKQRLFAAGCPESCVGRVRGLGGVLNFILAGGKS